MNHIRNNNNNKLQQENDMNEKVLVWLHHSAVSASQAVANEFDKHGAVTTMRKSKLTTLLEENPHIRCSVKSLPKSLHTKFDISQRDVLSDVEKAAYGHMPNMGANIASVTLPGAVFAKRVTSGGTRFMELFILSATANGAPLLGTRAQQTAGLVVDQEATGCYEEDEE